MYAVGLESGTDTGARLTGVTVTILISLPAGTDLVRSILGNCQNKVGQQLNRCRQSRLLVTTGATPGTLIISHNMTLERGNTKGRDGLGSCRDLFW